MFNQNGALWGCIVWGAVGLGCSDSVGSSESGDAEIVYGEAEFTVDASISEVIPTVGIVTWSADIRGIESATIGAAVALGLGIVVRIREEYGSIDERDVQEIDLR